MFKIVFDMFYPVKFLLLFVCVFVVYEASAQSNSCVRSKSLSQSLILNDPKIDIEYPIQHFISLESLVNPKKIFVELNKGGSGVMDDIQSGRYLNALLFKGICTNEADRIVKYFRQHSMQMPYSIFLMQSKELSDAKDLIISKKLNLADLCSFELVGFPKEDGNECAWTQVTKQEYLITSD